jgi:hypothetical protein
MKKIVVIAEDGTPEQNRSRELLPGQRLQATRDLEKKSSGEFRRRRAMKTGYYV